MADTTVEPSSHRRPDAPSSDASQSIQHQSKGDKRLWFVAISVTLGMLLMYGFMNSLDGRRPVDSIQRRPPPLSVGSELNGLVPEFPLQKTTFSDLTVSWPSTEQWMQGSVSNSEWNELMNSLHRVIPHGGGFLKVDHPERFLLPPPLTISWPEKPTVYSLSVFHQLHCFGAILEDYRKIHIGQSPTQPLHHILHCFDFLRQAILCCGDCTMEPNKAVALHHQGNVPEMNTVRVCKNINNIIEFANKNQPRRTQKTAK
nr:uncharacterized protein CTRU02_08411 [Colletotrichum truncatum]XP_036587995.1 uncharacterized protein CTRU02_02007 [Colletotrichum truncatum]KAF6790282.1 hypothetical protein CTRU02_08411 [Colletotrichum truncatum]KAF6799136.1 hypothetical protein CTRU02_02007 [Colletotrichum truncatum]